jgi:hypothetical protein
MLKAMTALGAILAANLCHAATFTVTSTADDGSAGTLRWAIEQANSDTTRADEIVFDPALAGATIAFADPSASGNFPPLFGELVVDGDDAPGLQIDRNGGGRIFIVSSNASITLRNLHLVNSTGLFGGACVRISGGEPNVLVERVQFTGCETSESSGGADAFGGAIYADMDAGGELFVRFSTFIDNEVRGDDAEVYGGAVYAEGGTVSISSSRFENNAAINLDQAFTGGGAVYIRDADTTLTRNVFEGNDNASGAGGALSLNIRPTQSAGLTGNLFLENAAELGAALWTGTQTPGGAPAFDLVNNQFIANLAGPSSIGGAIYFRDGTIRMRNNTMARNSALSSGAAHMGYRGGTDPVVFSQFWNNAFGKAQTNACKVSGSAVSFPSAGYNLFPDNSCQITGPGTIIDADASFFPAGPNGGPIFTAPPVAGNPAIDGGNPGAPDNSDWTRCPLEDARLVNRPFDGDDDGTAVCDMGAFEWQTTEPDPLPPLLQDRFETTP